jgi:hypothetical protein
MRYLIRRYGRTLTRPSAYYSLGFLRRRLHRRGGSLECRNCHEFHSMDFTRQSKRAAQAHSTRGARCPDRLRLRLRGVDLADHGGPPGG